MLEELPYNSSLILASLNSLIEIVKLFIDFNAKINMLNPERQIALYLAIIKRNIEYIDMLLDYSADIDYKGSFS